MGGVTPNYDWPFPSPSDQLNQGAGDLQRLATAIDATLKPIGDRAATAETVNAKQTTDISALKTQVNLIKARFYANRASFAVTAGMSEWERALTFPAGQFSASPVLCATVTSSSAYWLAGCTGLSASGFTAQARHLSQSGSAYTAYYNYQACLVGNLTSGVAATLSAAPNDDDVAPLNDAGVPAKRFSVTCTTSGCFNNGKKIRMWLWSQAVTCGVCGNDITEIEPA